MILVASGIPQKWYDPIFSAPEAATFLAQPGGILLVVGPAEAPYGHILARTVADEAEILTLYVAPGQRRQGHAQQLLMALADHMGSGVTAVHAEVRSQNTAARKLYVQVGFTETGHRANYYTNPVDDAVLLTWARLC